MRLAITGCDGMLGKAVVKAALSSGFTSVYSIPKRDMDISKRDEVFAKLKTMPLDGVINCAAYTNVDEAEKEPYAARLTNAVGVRNLSEACMFLGLHLVNVSTDYVFDGKQEKYIESSKPNPLNEYGKSKLMGERQTHRNFCTVRTSWLFGMENSCIVDTILTNAIKGADMQFVYDQIGYPTCAEDLAINLLMLVLERASGIYHITNTTSVSWHGFANDVLYFGGLDNLSKISPILSTDLNRPALRPNFSLLESTKELPFSMPSYKDSLSNVVLSKIENILKAN